MTDGLYSDGTVNNSDGYNIKLNYVKNMKNVKNLNKLFHVNLNSNIEIGSKNDFIDNVDNNDNINDNVIDDVIDDVIDNGYDNSDHNDDNDKVDKTKSDDMDDTIDDTTGDDDIDDIIYDNDYGRNIINKMVDDITDNILDEMNNDDKNIKKNQQLKIKKYKKPIIKFTLYDAVKTVDERSLYAKVNRYFRTKCTDDQIYKMIRIINNEDTTSLRLLNWFAMKHSATMEALQIAHDDGNIELFDVKISYKARLKTHSKKYFDPFRRGKRFDYYYDKKDDSKFIETTLCQLNFFRWLFMHNLMDYVDNNFEYLKQKMGIYEKKKKDTKKKEKEKIKKTIVKNKKEDIKVKIKRFNDNDSSKLVIII